MTTLKLTLTERIGQLFFSGMTHKYYDYFLYRFVTKIFWRCDTQAILDQYLDNLSGNHLEVGVGTGFLLEKTLSEECPPDLMLMDLNQVCLDKAAVRLKVFNPTIMRRNILQPISGIRQKFDSIAINYVLHCVEGDFNVKGVAFEHIGQCLNTGGVMFGATILRHGVNNSLPALGFMKALNWMRVFNNWDDDIVDLERALRKVFDEVEIVVVGSVAIFRGVK